MHRPVQVLFVGVLWSRGRAARAGNPVNGLVRQYLEALEEAPPTTADATARGAERASSPSPSVAAAAAKGWDWSVLARTEHALCYQDGDEPAAGGMLSFSR